MKRYLAICIILVMLCGCAQNGKPIDRAMSLRQSVLMGNGCSFLVMLTADYQDICYEFTMKCDADGQGNVHFEVTSPDSINGIKGRISEGSGQLTFDDQALLFSMMADGQISPVCGPWIFLKALRNGYIDSCAQDDDGLLIRFSDTIADNVVRINVLTSDNIPVFAEIIYDEKRILSMQIENFCVL